MSFNVFGDPFICHYSKTEALQDAGSEVPFSAFAQGFSGYFSFHQVDPQWNSRACPSEPISPSVSRSDSCCSTPSVDDSFFKAEQSFYPWHCPREEISLPNPIKAEPTEEYYPPNSHLSADSSSFSNDLFTERNNLIPECDLEERYQDFMQFLKETTDLNGLEIDSMPYESLEEYSSESASMKKRNSQKPRKAGSSPRASSGQQTSPVASRNALQRKRKSNGNDTRFEQSRNSSSLSGDDDSSATSSKRSKGLSSEESYAQRREKNNTAVRKSREKKRQENQRFLEEHEKLKKEIETIKTQNDQLQTVLAEVEDGLLDTGKSKEELTALVQSAKKQLLQ
ncbi:uncharacterized protein LOC129580694 isoform X2 [Paramacrobiotus metropolitanus]|uniref:uncharacterized protein LOC129580694 isoform X2 n=1 Tax=Paramacrobiotus metropolitanus TaxID=2943436 RepID=UPI0024461620|nr:uncharacterized protein LOC129580694 isoform X2 [Paramacrobiotus metropolitanus]